jgi:hypothetical protein
MVTTVVGYIGGKPGSRRFAMGRKANETRIQEIASLLQAQPGCKAGEYARMLGMHREDFNRALVQLNDRGILLAEDDNGHLWPFQQSES